MRILTVAAMMLQGHEITQLRIQRIIARDNSPDGMATESTCVFLTTSHLLGYQNARRSLPPNPLTGHENWASHPRKLTEPCAAPAGAGGSDPGQYRL
jgi:hypothetical protein